MSLRLLLLLVSVVFITGGCATNSNMEADTKSEQNNPTSVSQDLEPDPEIISQLNQYRDSLNTAMNEKIAVITDTLHFGKPESSLGNLAADALRFRAASHLRKFIHVGVIGSGSFKIFFTPGELTLGDLYEFMPYDNHLVVLTMTGQQIQDLSDQVAALGGAPVSGLRFRLRGNRAQGVLVNAEVIDLTSTYLVATSNFIADGGDAFPALWNPVDRIDLEEVSIRELYLNFFKNRRELSPATDGRIR